MSNQTPGSDLDSSGLLLFAVRWRRTLLLISAAAAVLSFTASLLIRDKYESSVILFPVNSNSTARALFSDGESRSDILAFGEEEAAERMLQVLQSDEIRNRIIEKYDLARHYGIEMSAKHALTYLHTEYKSNVTFRRTEFMSVVVTVRDREPERAAGMANDIAELLDSSRHRIVMDRAAKALEIIETELGTKVEEVGSFEDTLRKLRLLGVFNIESQSEVLSEQYAVALIKGNKPAADSIKRMLNTLAEHGSAFNTLNQQYWAAMDQARKLRLKYEQARVDVAEAMPFKFVVNKAVPSDKKAYPVRWLIVVISVAASLIVSMLVIVSVEKAQLLNQQTKRA